MRHKKDYQMKNISSCKAHQTRKNACSKNPNIQKPRRATKATHIENSTVKTTKILRSAETTPQEDIRHITSIKNDTQQRIQSTDNNSTSKSTQEEA